MSKQGEIRKGNPINAINALKYFQIQLKDCMTVCHYLGVGIIKNRVAINRCDCMQVGTQCMNCRSNSMPNVPKLLPQQFLHLEKLQFSLKSVVYQNGPKCQQYLGYFCKNFKKSPNLDILCPNLLTVGVQSELCRSERALINAKLAQKPPVKLSQSCTVDQVKLDHLNANLKIHESFSKIKNAKSATSVKCKCFGPDKNALHTFGAEISPQNKHILNLINIEF